MVDRAARWVNTLLPEVAVRQVVDGVYVEDRVTGRLRWFRSRHRETEDGEGLIVRIADPAEAWLARRVYGRGDASEAGEDDALSLIQSASVAEDSAARGGRRAKRVQVRLLHSAEPTLAAPTAARTPRWVHGACGGRQ